MPALWFWQATFWTSRSLVGSRRWEPSCSVCRGFAPIYEEAAGRHPDVTFGKIDTESEITLAKQFEIFSIPTLLAVKDGEIMYAKPGTLTSDKLEKLIAEMRAYVSSGEPGGSDGVVV